MSSVSGNAWFRTLSQLAAVLLVAGLLGLAVGHFWPALALAALLVVAWHFLKLHDVQQRLTARRRLQPQHGHGIWNQLDQLLYRGQSEMRARKQRLLAMLRAYRAAADVLPDAVVVVERNQQRILWFNAAAKALLGLRHPQHRNAPVASALSSLPMAQWLAAGRNAEPMQDVASPADPDLRLQLRLLPYSEEFWLLIARDITQTMRVEQMRRDFVANVSHELRTPLTVVHGYLEMLEDDDNPQWSPVLEEMRRQSLRMTRLVEDLLTLSRLDARETLIDETVPMSPMLASLQREAEALSQGRHQVLLEDAAQDVDLRGAGKELHSAFSNLVSNAVRYTPAGGQIRVRFAHEPDGGACLSVTDTGHGIPASHLPRLTERFYRVSNSRSRESGGTGLGLAIVKHVLGLHGAQLSIVSEVDIGSTFACHFGADRIIHRVPSPSGVPAP
ncbi:MAG: phosphate regulon sensor histidine kinase PhoR [Xanthomonadaceae bacterium]|nr:phosphate regulon sensor histidine kinase PhoR [Xanthomonadaceae bacterium]